MLEYNEIKEGKYIVVDGSPYEVLSSHVFRKQQRKPVNAVKLKQLITGKVIERSFHQSETVPEADLEKRNIIYLYSHRNEFWFAEEKNPGKRFQLPAPLLGEAIKFLKGGTVVTGLLFEENYIGVMLPIKVLLIVTEAPPSFKGNTAGGGKQVIVETGASIQVPFFVAEGDTIRVNTETGEYVERVEK